MDFESAQINDAQKKKLDVFQLKGFRKMVNMKTTFTDRNNTNELVYQIANEEVNKLNQPSRDHPNPKQPKPKQIVKLSEYYESRTLFKKLRYHQKQKQSTRQ